MKKTMQVAENIKKALNVKKTSVKSIMEIAEDIVKLAINKKRRKLSKTQTAKLLDAAKEEYKKLYNKFSNLSTESKLLNTTLQSTEIKMKAARLYMLKLNSYMRDMDLSGSTNVVVQKDSDDVSYIKDGQEYHLEVDVSGEVTSTPIKDFLKSKKNKIKENKEEEKEDAEEKENVEELEEVEEGKEIDESEIDEKDMKDLFGDLSDADVEDDVKIKDYKIEK